MYALRVYFLGPFLFGQSTLCEKVGSWRSLTTAAVDFILFSYRQCSLPLSARCCLPTGMSVESWFSPPPVCNPLLPSSSPFLPHHHICSGVWPMFFEQDKWHRVQLIVKVVTTTVKLCVSDYRNNFADVGKWGAMVCATIPFKGSL